MQECIGDVQWMVDNPEDRVERRKRLWPKSDDSEMATKTFHGFTLVPMELQLAIWEMHVATLTLRRHWDDPDLDISYDFTEKLNALNERIDMRKFVGPSSQAVIYYRTFRDPNLGGCRLLRLMLLTSWRKMLPRWFWMRITRARSTL